MPPAVTEVLSETGGPRRIHQVTELSNLQSKPMQIVTSILRSLAALLVFAGLCAAQEPNVEGSATFPGETYACVFEDANTEDSSGTGTVQPNPQGQPPGPVLTVRWDKVMIDGVEWIEIWRS